MKRQNWFRNKLKAFKEDFEFRFETLVLDLTENICKRMAQKNINRIELARRLHVSPPAVTKILSGNSNFTLKTLLSIADALDQELAIDFKEKETVASYRPVVENILVQPFVPFEEELFCPPSMLLTADAVTYSGGIEPKFIGGPPRIEAS